MSSLFFQRITSAGALLLGVAGFSTQVHAMTVQQRAPRTAEAKVGSQMEMYHALAAQRRLQDGAQKTETGSRGKTPFSQYVLPRIKEQQAKARAEKAMNPAKADAAFPGVTEPGGLGVNFPGFYHPPLVTTTPVTDGSDVYFTLTTDVNKDGKPDIVSIQSNGALNVSLNTGTGLPSIVTSTNKSATTFSLNPAWADSVDLNGDGYPDIELTDYNANVYIFMNNGAPGNGTYAPAVQIQIAPALPSGNSLNFAPYWTSGDVIFADVTGDGTPDMVVLSGQNPDPNAYLLTLQTFAGAGDGTFPSVSATQTFTLTDTAFYGSFHGLKAFDVNGDGKLDLIYPFTAYGHASTTNVPFGYTYVLTGGNSGIFSPMTQVSDTSPNAYSVGTFEYLSWSYAGYATGKGTPFVAAVGDLALYTQRVNTNGSLQAPVMVPNAETNYANWVNFADVTGDGNVDAVVYAYKGYFSVYAGAGDGTFSQSPVARIVSGYSDRQQGMPADFDGDGILDIVDADYYSSAAMYPGTGGGHFKGAPVLGDPLKNAYHQEVILSGDLTGHGFADVLLYDYTGSATTLVTGVNDGHGNFTYQTAVSSASLGMINLKFVEPFAVDLNGDQKPDLLISAANGLYGSLNNGDGTFADPVQIQLPSGNLDCEPTYGASADFNNDGKLDIVVAYPGCATGSNMTAGFYTLLNNGGTFPNNYTVSFTASGAHPYEISVADFNRDGSQDMALVDNGYIYVFSGMGDGTFDTVAGAQPIYYSPGLAGVVVGDYDQDGKQDITAFGSLSGFGAALLKGNGDLTFQTGVPSSFGFVAYGASYADFNGDGMPDLLLSGEADDTPYDVGLAYQVNLGLGNFSAPILLPSRRDNQNFASEGYNTRLMLGDFNGDGTIDFLGASNYSTGVFYNAGAVSLALTTSAPTVVQNHSITLTATLTPSMGTMPASGSISFFAKGGLIGKSDVAGNAALLTLSTLPVGSDALTAVYSGDANYNIVSSSANVNTTIAVAPISTATLNLTTSSATAVQDSPVTLTATLVPTSGSAAVTGSVTFSDNGSAIGMVTLSGNVASMVMSSMPVGANLITAVYSGDANYAAATSSSNVATTVAVTPLAAAFTMAPVSGSSLDLVVGQTGVATFSVTGNATFNGPITFACAGAPKGTSCTISPATVTLSGTQSATVTVVLDTTAPNNHYNAANFMPGWMKTTGGITLAGGLLLLLPSRRRRQIWPLVLFATLGLGAAVSLTGCDHKYDGTPAGSYSMNVTASSGAMTQTGTISLTLHK